jgi:hypothetical protein
MLVITSTSPEVSNLLGLDVGDLERGAIQRRSGKLENRQGRSVVSKRLSHPGDLGDQRRKTETSFGDVGG